MDPPYGRRWTEMCRLPGSFLAVRSSGPQNHPKGDESSEPARRRCTQYGTSPHGPIAAGPSRNSPLEHDQAALRRAAFSLCGKPATRFSVCPKGTAPLSDHDGHTSQQRLIGGHQMTTKQKIFSWGGVAAGIVLVAFG